MHARAIQIQCHENCLSLSRDCGHATPQDGHENPHNRPSPTVSDRLCLIIETNSLVHSPHKLCYNSVGTTCTIVYCCKPLLCWIVCSILLGVVVSALAHVPLPPLPSPVTVYTIHSTQGTQLTDITHSLIQRNVTYCTVTHLHNPLDNAVPFLFPLSLCPIHSNTIGLKRS